jgi:hypothetical protein
MKNDTVEKVNGHEQMRNSAQRWKVKEAESEMQNAVLEMKNYSSAPVAHTWKPSYSGGRDQEDNGLKPAGVKSSVQPYLKNPFTKIRLVKWLSLR